MKQNCKGLFQDWEIAVAKNLVNEFRDTQPCLQRESFEDLLQKCLVHWFFVKNGYEPTRGASPQTFMGRVIRNKLTDLVREHQADKRKLNHLAISLDEPMGNDEDSHTLEDTIADTHPPPILQVELKIDLSNVLQRLDPHKRQLCNLIGKKGFGIKEASDQLGMPRSTIYDEIKRIRAIFLKEGLEEYLR